MRSRMWQAGVVAAEEALTSGIIEATVASDDRRALMLWVRLGESDSTILSGRMVVYLRIGLLLLPLMS